MSRGSPCLFDIKTYLPSHRNFWKQATTLTRTSQVSLHAPLSRSRPLSRTTVFLFDTADAMPQQHRSAVCPPTPPRLPQREISRDRRERPLRPQSGHMRRKIAAAPANVCFGERGQAAWGESDRQLWADLAMLRLREIGPAAHHPTAALGSLRWQFGTKPKAFLSVTKKTVFDPLL